jgi:hypothetical protein
VAGMSVDRVDGNEELSRDLGPRVVGWQVAQYAQLARAELRRLRQRSWFGARASQHVDDIGQKGAMSRFVTRERVEQLCGFGQCKREDQTVWLGGGERCLGGGSGGFAIPHG